MSLLFIRRWVGLIGATARPGLLWLALGLGAGWLLFKPEAAPEGAIERPVQAASKQEVWSCSMHPHVHQSAPGKCPICGMDLIPQANDFPGVETPNRVRLSERARALARLRTTTVSRSVVGSDAVQIRMLGRIEPNEKTRRNVTVWTGGRIDRLHVRATGERIRKGQVVATLYSPEVFAAHQDLIVARRQVARLAQALPASQDAALQGLAAARERLKLLGIPESKVAQLESQETPTRSVAIRSPYSGTVLERVATEGAFVSAGAPLYKLADLSALWVQLEAYESDLAQLRLGQRVNVQVDALPGESFEGKLTFIDPTVDAKKRTAQVRVEVGNSDGRLRTGMFAQAVVYQEEGSAQSRSLTVPATAVLFTGRRSVVYVEVQDGDKRSYEPRTVRLGPRTGESYPVVAGLSEGEQVVSRGAFALDADLQIRGGESMMMRPDDHERGRDYERVQITPAEREKLAPVVEAYLALQTSLAADELKPAQAAAGALAAAAETLQSMQPAEAYRIWSMLRIRLRLDAAQIRDASSLEQSRVGFEGLSAAITELVARLGNPLGKELFLAHCPMAFGSKGASWIQSNPEIDNSYFGESMRTCGEVHSHVGKDGYLSVSAVDHPAASSTPGDPSP